MNTVQVRFDGFGVWGSDIGLGEKIHKFLGDRDICLDDWYRGCFELSQKDFRTLKSLADDENAKAERCIISVSLATGTENTISVGRYFTTSWQWN